MGLKAAARRQAPKTTSNPMHLATSGERYTPPSLVEPIRRVLGGVIHLDPASSAKANRIIRARTYYSARQNGLTKPWTRPGILNAPGSCPWDARRKVYKKCGNEKRCSCGLVGRFWDKLAISVWTGIGSVPYFVWVGFQLGQLQTLQGRPLPKSTPVPAALTTRVLEQRIGKTIPAPATYPTCILRERVRYLDHNLREMPQPSHGSYVTLVTRSDFHSHAARLALARFRDEFSSRGDMVGLP